MPTVIPPRQEFARIFLILVLIFFLYISPDSPSSGTKSYRDSSRDHIFEYKNLLNVLNSTRWQDFIPHSSLKDVSEPDKYLNLTGFKESDGYRGWEVFNEWKERCMLFHQKAYGRSENKESQEKIYYTNVTGAVQGQWKRYEPHRTELENGTWPKMNLSEIAPNSMWEMESNEPWMRNITGKTGKIKLRFEAKNVELDIEPKNSEEASIGPLQEVLATVTLNDESAKGGDWIIRIHGVHWPRKGILLMTTTSEKFAGIFGLPHLTFSLEQFVSSQQLLNRTLGKVVQNLERNSKIDYENQWSSIPEDETAHLNPYCEYIVFVQIYPIEIDNTLRHQRQNLELIAQEIERELRWPIGAPIPKIPKLQASVVILSPDCGFMLESKGLPSSPSESSEILVGEKQEVIIKNIHYLLEIFTVMIFGQTLLLKAQSKDASTPSTVARVSLYTISTMLFADAFIFVSLSLVSGTSPNLFPSALLASFMSLMSVMLGIRFLSAIWSSQEPERRERLREASPTDNLEQQSPSQLNTSPQVSITSASSVTSPNIAIDPTNDNPIIIPSDQDIDAEVFENTLNSTSSLLPITNPNVGSAQVRSQPRGISFATLYIRSVLLLTLVLFLTLTSTSWPSWLRTIYIYILSIIYLSFPAYQIYRNVQRNCRKALLWKFVIGQSILRLTPFAYFYLRKENILYLETDVKAFFILAAWLCIQCWILAAQNIFGPRWGLPKTWYAEGWNYHPILRMENLEAKDLPIGLVQNNDQLSPTRTLVSVTTPVTTDKRRNKSDISLKCVDCAICMQTLDVPILETGRDSKTDGVAGILESRRYMVTPCRHIFHSTCLEEWMRFRLQCPICRENLPPL